MWATGEPFVYTNWISNEPGDTSSTNGKDLGGNEDHLGMANAAFPNGGWFDIHGASQLGFVVEKDPVADSDGDDVPDDQDNCPGTQSGDIVDTNGCSIAQYCPCNKAWRNHGAYVLCVAKTSESFLNQGLITQGENDAIVSAAARSSCGGQK